MSATLGKPASELTVTQILRQLLDRASTDVRRSSALHPLQWMMAIISTALLVAISQEAETWLLIVIGSMISVLLVFYCVMYCYLARKKPDSLRSEWYSLQKMQIERNYLGDDRTALIEQSTTIQDSDSKLITGTTEHKKGSGL